MASLLAEGTPQGEPGRNAEGTGPGWFDTDQDNNEIAGNIRYHELLAQTVKTRNDETDEHVEECFEAVDRGMFLPTLCYFNSSEELQLSNEGFLQAVYRDGPFKFRPFPFHQSAPSLYCRALHALELNTGDSFLQVGSGTGYFQQMVNLMIGVDAVSHGIELNRTNVAFAQEATARYEFDHPAYSGATPSFYVGDAFQIDARRNIKYDKIYVAGGCTDDDQLQFLELLKPGGVLVGPFGSSFLKMKKNHVGEVETESLCSVVFQPLEKPAAAGDAGPMIVLQPFVFSPDAFEDAPKRFREAANALMVLSRAKGELPGKLPTAIWLLVLQMCSGDWFEYVPTEVETLQRGRDIS